MIAKSAPGNFLRLWLLKACGYKIGREVYIGEDLIIADDLEDEKVTLILEDRVSIAPRVTFVLYSAPNNSRIRPYVNERKGSVIVRQDAWIGTGAVIHPNVEIGEGAVVGSNSVVTKNIPAYTFVAGIPAKAVNIIDVPYRSREADIEQDGTGDVT